MRKQLTEVMVTRQAPPETGRLEIFDSIVPALALRVTPTGARTFVVRGRIRGQPGSIRVTIGDARGMKLSDARQQASDVLQQMRAGNDPRSKKADPAAVLTFDGLINEWSRLYLAHNHRPRYVRETPATIRKHFTSLLKRPAAQITKADVVNAIDKIASPGAARNPISYARSCFGWAEKRGKVPSNPFSDLPDAPTGGSRERVLSHDEVADLWTAAEALGYPFGPFYQLEILTLQRREMVAAMRWSEIDGDLWRIPGPRMKMGKPHDVHLSEPARAILASIPRIAGCNFVFTTTGTSPISGFSKAKRHLDAAIGKMCEAAGREPMAPWVPHDLRRTGVSKLAELGFDSIVADKLLAHKPAKLQGAAAIYQRYEFLRERAQALDAWAAHVTGERVENVTPLRAAR